MDTLGLADRPQAEWKKGKYSCTKRVSQLQAQRIVFHDKIHAHP
jgi:hypothetical protein